MWVPNTVQVPWELVLAEHRQEVPVGTIVAAAVFTMNGATKETAKQIAKSYSLTPVTAAAAWKFLQTGQIGGNGGATANPEPIPVEERSPETREGSNPPSESWDSESRWVIELFEEYFPNAIPDERVAGTIAQLAGDNMKLVEALLINMTHGPEEPRSPIGLALHLLRNQNHEDILSIAADHTKKGKTGNSIVREAMRKAEAMIPTLPTPEATPQTVDLLQQLKEQVERGRT